MKFKFKPTVSKDRDATEKELKCIEETERKFKCPCHGSGFRSSGINFEGPAPRPLERYKISLANDGQILIDKTKHYEKTSNKHFN